MTTTPARLGILLASLVFSASAEAVTIWDGPAIEFTKEAFADPTLPQNQDRLTDSVAITRASIQGIYNAAEESGYVGTSPAGTLWAVGTTSDLGSLSFDTWVNTVGLTSPIGGPNNSVGVDFVVHLTDEDIFLDLQITEWGVGAGAGGSFSYTRSTPAVPEPATLAGATLAIVAGFAARRRGA